MSAQDDFEAGLEHATRLSEQLTASWHRFGGELFSGTPAYEFSPERRNALRSIVEDWISEGFTTPPYTDAQYDIFEWLDLSHQNVGGYDTRRPAETTGTRPTRPNPTI